MDTTNSDIYSGSWTSTQDRQTYVCELRKLFSVRPDFPQTHTILHPDGTLNQAYFHPKGPVQMETRKWTEEHRDLLITGLGRYGVGGYREMIQDTALFSDWSPHDLRIRTQRLLGRQNLQGYRGWKPVSKEAIEAEYDRNRRIGLELGGWKGQMLVLDEEGRVAEAIKEGDEQLLASSSSSSLKREEA
ncbi:MAG: hypothetical protein DHS80DRAFT_15457 [Piptocephalis tieghemiana]|nr:MAG: hypothetical protein DHS80DRAFT_15457 [Piptocephalis tieghemiana]